MDMTGERRIPAPRDRVWAALNDPDILKACIPGCESLERVSETEMRAAAAVKIGPIAARFTGKVDLSDIDPPNGYTISGEGQGGVAGFAKGGAAIRLAEDEGATKLSYDVKAQVGGKIAQLGARLVDATAKQMADMFFDRFTQRMTLGQEARPASPTIGAALDPAQPAGPAPVSAPPAPMAISMLSLLPKEPFGLPLVAWIGGAIFLVIFILLFSSYL